MKNKKKATGRTYPRFSLAMLRLRHAHVLVDAMRHKEFLDGVQYKKKMGLKEAEREIGRQLAAMKEGNLWALSIRCGDRIAGRIGIERLRHGAPYRLWFWVHPKYRNRGVATEAVNLLVNIPTSRDIAAIVLRQNATDIGVLEDNGFIREATKGRYATYVRRARPWRHK